jgi:ubiquinone biosynthesis accessory factor UbiJ
MSPLTPFEALLNRNIANSTAAQRACRKLEGKSLTIVLSGTPLHFTLKSLGDRISVAAAADVSANAKLRGTPLSLMRLMRERTAGSTQNVYIEGDAEVVQTYADLLHAAQPDLEEELARLVGDVAAHQIGEAARSLLRFGERARDTFARNVAEFLQEESRDLVTRTEADEFVRDVDTLRDDVERLSARIDRLERTRLG